MTAPPEGKEPVLLPCPFCGSAKDPEVTDYLDGIDGPDAPSAGGYMVVCAGGSVGDGCGVSTGWTETPEKAAAAWNRRVVPAPQQAAPTAPQDVSAQPSSPPGGPAVVSGDAVPSARDGATALRAAEVECDCCGKRVPADEVSTIAAERAFGAQCETTVCDDCRGMR